MREKIMHATLTKASIKVSFGNANTLVKTSTPANFQFFMFQAVALLTGCLVVEADSEAFFLPNLLSRSGSRSSVRHQVHHPAQLRAHGRQQRQIFSPSTRQHQHTRQHFAARPTRQIKSIFPSPNVRHPNIHHATHARNKNVLPPVQDPGARMKLDFGGWTPIDFDENLPAKLKRGIKISDLKSVRDSVKSGNIVTIDTAIAAAPPAESDDIHHHHQAPTAAAAPAVPAVPYIPSTADHSSVIYVDSSNAPISSYNILDANNPAVAPKYEPAKPSFQAPQYIPRPAVPSKPYQPQPPALAPKYEPKPAVTPVKASPPVKSPTRPRYQPAPATPPKYEEPQQTALPAFTPTPAAPAPVTTVGVDNEKYPIVALITAESDVPDEEKFVQFSINGGSPDTLIDLSDNDIRPNTRPAKDVTKESDELYYIYYQDPELDPSFGVKIQSERDTKKYLGLDGLDIPVYDYDEAAVYRPERDQPSFGVKSSSSVSFNQSVGGKKSGFSYNLS